MGLPKSDIRVGQVYSNPSQRCQRLVLEIGGQRPDYNSNHMNRGYADEGVRYLEAKKPDTSTSCELVTWLSLFAVWGDHEAVDDEVFEGIKARR